MTSPKLSVIIPTFNNVAVLRRCLESWERYASDQPVELIVVEDGCRDGTVDYLREVERTPWGLRVLRWVHEDDVNQLRCNNRGFREARAPLSSQLEGKLPAVTGRESVWPSTTI